MSDVSDEVGWLKYCNDGPAHPVNAPQDEVECPLCLDTLSFDDLSFFPCSCGYQVGMAMAYTCSMLTSDPLDMPLLLASHQSKPQRQVSSLQKAIRRCCSRVQAHEA